MCGYIKLHRQLAEWRWYQDSKVLHLFLHLLIKASTTNRTYKHINLKKGQLITSYGLLAEQTGLSVQSVRTVLDKLKSTNEITQTTNMQFTIVTVKKWEFFQSSSTNNQQTNNTVVTNEQQTINKPLTNEQQTDNKRLTTVEEVKERDILENNNLTVITKDSSESYQTPTQKIITIEQTKPIKKKSNRGTRFTAQRDQNQNAIIPQEYYRYAAQQGMQHQDINIMFQKFANHWETTTKNPTKLDWLKTWQNWVLSDYSNKRPARNSQQASTVEVFNDITNAFEQHQNADFRPVSSYTK